MKSLLAAICLALQLPPITAGELRQEIDSAKEAFHHALHEAPAIYLVCYYKVEKKLWNGDWEQLDIQATIVDVVRGDQKVSDRIDFERVMDGKYGDISKLAGMGSISELYTPALLAEHPGIRPAPLALVLPSSWRWPTWQPSWLPWPAR